MPDRAIILTRISDARDGDKRGVSDQLADCLRLAERLGWTVGPAQTHHVVENDTSAFKRRKVTLPDGTAGLRTVRPGFRRALAMLSDGRADGLIFYDLDRLARQPRDLEDLIDVIEMSRPRIPVESVTGSLRLDGDVSMARITVAIANKASADTARRVARARMRQAEAGQFGGGQRRYGFERDGVTIRETEADEIRRASSAILSGVSLRQITADLRARQVPTAQGAAWNAITLRDILLRPRNAGLMVYRPAASGGPIGVPYTDAEIIGKAAWEPILPETQWRAVCAILTDPARRAGAGAVPRWLGTRIYRCGVCDDGTTLVVMGSTSGAKKSTTRYSRYTCSPERQGDGRRMHGGWHLARSAVPLDEYVETAIIARLRQPDANDLVPVPPEVDMTALRSEEASLTELLDEQARLHARRVITGAQLEAGSRELQASLTEVRSAIAAAAESSPLAGLAGRPDIGDVWPGLDLGRKRAILRVLAEVTIRPARPCGPKFDPESLDIRWLNANEPFSGAGGS